MEEKEEAHDVIPRNINNPLSPFPSNPRCEEGRKGTKCSVQHCLILLSFLYGDYEVVERCLQRNLDHFLLQEVGGQEHLIIGSAFATEGRDGARLDAWAVGGVG